MPLPVKAIWTKLTIGVVKIFFRGDEQSFAKSHESFVFANDLQKFLALQNDLLRPINFHAKVGDERDFCKKDERRFCSLISHFCRKIKTNKK